MEVPFFVKKEMIMTRREERELAFVLLFEQAVTGDTIPEIIVSAEDLREVKVETFALKLACGTDSNLVKIDEVINKYSRGWKVDRLAKVSAAVLRLCVYELIFEKDIPISVSINEAVEIAKTYATVEDASYVNGVLSSIAKDKEIMGDKK